MELEQDLSAKPRFLDVMVLREEAGHLRGDPDGGPGEHSLLTDESHHHRSRKQ